MMTVQHHWYCSPAGHKTGIRMTIENTQTNTTSVQNSFQCSCFTFRADKHRCEWECLSWAEKEKEKGIKGDDNSRMNSLSFSCFLSFLRCICNAHFSAAFFSSRGGGERDKMGERRKLIEIKRVCMWERKTKRKKAIEPKVRWSSFATSFENDFWLLFFLGFVVSSLSTQFSSSCWTRRRLDKCLSLLPPAFYFVLTLKLLVWPTSEVNEQQQWTQVQCFDSGGSVFDSRESLPTHFIKPKASLRVRRQWNLRANGVSRIL